MIAHETGRSERTSEAKPETFSKLHLIPNIVTENFWFLRRTNAISLISRKEPNLPVFNFSL